MFKVIYDIIDLVGEVMDEIKELFKRDMDRYEYMYAKCNSKSKKEDLAYDLIFFKEMYNKFFSEKVSFSWDNDMDLFNVKMDIVNGFIINVLKEQDLLKDIIGNNFLVFLEEDYSFYTDYSKSYHTVSEELMQKYIASFFRSIDSSLVNRFREKLIKEELFINNGISGYLGLTYPLEIVDKNIILFVGGDKLTIKDVSALVHELGHDFEFGNDKSVGMVGIWKNISKTIYFEVCSSFFEYAFINYLIDNRIYYEDSVILMRRYLNQLYYYLSKALIMLNIEDIRMEYNYKVILDNIDNVLYANRLMEEMNYSGESYKLGDKINFRESFIYAIGRLLSIYIYELNKDNLKDMLFEFRRVLLDYKDNNFESFKLVGIDRDVVSNGEVLRRVIKNSR